MIEVLNSDTHTLVHDELVTGVFGNCDLGNVDPRFGLIEDFQASRLNALRALAGREAISMSQLIIMEPVGKQGFTDLNKGSHLRTDGLITTDPDVVISGNPADCEMIGMYGQGSEHPVLGLIHVSRGIAGLNGHGIALKYLSDNYGLSPQQTKIIFAPSIRAESYRFPSIDEKQKEDSGWAPYIYQDDDELWHVDVHNKIVSELCAQGVPVENMHDSLIDVGADSNHFSHRRYVEQQQTRGRNAVMLKLNSSA